MTAKKDYSKPKVESRKIRLGVYGNYGRENQGTPTPPSKPPLVYPSES